MASRRLTRYLLLIGHEGPLSATPAVVLLSWWPGSQLVLVSPLLSLLQSVQEQQSIHRASTELVVCLQYCQQWRRNAMADPNSAVTPLLLIPSLRCYRYF